MVFLKRIVISSGFVATERKAVAGTMVQGGEEMRRLQKRLCLVATLVLLVGWGSAFALYLRARAVAESELVSEYENSKRFRHDLEAYGGTLNVLADQLTRWWESLWQGTTLPLTIACLTGFIALVVFLIAYRWPA